MYKKIFQQLKGVWRLERFISPGGHMSGEATFAPISDIEYHYTEQGILTLDHGDVIEDVKRSYIYKVKNETIQIYYNDGPDQGELFQVLVFYNSNEAQAEHLCGADLYKSEYSFDFPSSFQITHHVNGPKKNYVSNTVFNREK